MLKHLVVIIQRRYLKFGDLAYVKNMASVERVKRPSLHTLDC